MSILARFELILETSKYCNISNKIEHCSVQNKLNIATILTVVILNIIKYHCTPQYYEI